MAQERTQRETAEPKVAVDRTPDAPAKPKPLAPARSHAAWKACSDGVLKRLSAKGERESGNPGAYTGAGGAGATADIQKKCGYEPMTRQGCDGAYVHVCLEPRKYYDKFGDFSLSNADRSWIKSFDPRVFDERRLKSLCTAPFQISRAKFGALMCGEE